MFDRVQNMPLNNTCFLFLVKPFLPKTQNFPKTNISYLLIRTRTCEYQGVRNVSFSEHCACVINEWSAEKATGSPWQLLGPSVAIEKQYCYGGLRTNGLKYCCSTGAEIKFSMFYSYSFYLRRLFWVCFKPQWLTFEVFTILFPTFCRSLVQKPNLLHTIRTFTVISWSDFSYCCTCEK